MFDWPSLYLCAMKDILLADVSSGLSASHWAAEDLQIKVRKHGAGGTEEGPGVFYTL